MATLERAIAIAVEAHKGQCDKAGESYILHPLRVMFLLDTVEARIVGVMHDVCEDCADWSFARLRGEGFSEAVIAALQCLTRPRDEDYDAFIVRAGANPLARKVKLADLHDNADPSRIPVPTEKDRKRTEKYLRAIAYLEGLG